MKCPQCVEEGRRSCVYPGPASTTLAATQSYWDESGDFHDHDPNWTTTSCRCSRGHAFALQTRPGCSKCNLPFEEKVVPHYDTEGGTFIGTNNCINYTGAGIVVADAPKTKRVSF